MALSHVILHVALCNAAVRMKAQTAMLVHVSVVDRINRNAVDQDFRIVREDGSTATLAFDMPWGVYRANVEMKAGKTSCYAAKYFAVVVDHNRTLDLTLHKNRSRPIVPALIYGAAPFAFAYVTPTVEVFDKSVKCNGPVGDPLDAGVVTQNDADGFYATITPTRDLAAHAPLVVAVRLTDSRGDYHYIKVPTNFISFSSIWPSSGTINANENIIDYMTGKPEDTLLCPRLYETITH